MELKLIPTQINRYPIRAILIKGNNIADWLIEMQYMNINLRQATVYALPGRELNTLSGCLVILHQSIKIEDIRKNMLCQKISNKLYIPQYADITPHVSAIEVDNFFPYKPHFYHPESGLVELEEEISWGELIQVNNIRPANQIKPEETPYIPQKVSSFRVSVISQNNMENVLEEIEKKADVNKLKEKPLTDREKLKLYIYKKLIGNKDPEQITEHNYPRFLKFTNSLHKFFHKDKGKTSTGKLSQNWVERILYDYEELMRRNQSQVDKLLKLLNDDPETALNYAIPIDAEGTGRGGELAGFQLHKYSLDFSSLGSLFGNKRTGTGGGYYTLEDNAINSLQKQYRASAEKLIEEKKYLKASYIYIKLLKDNQAAVNMFENAKLYREAAEVYRDIIKDTKKAGECYEKANMYDEAIEMYKENKMYEKVGDMYLKLDNREKANPFYNKVLHAYIQNRQYLLAAEICQQKMDDIQHAQRLLLDGWKNFSNPYDCLSQYLSNIEKDNERGREIKRIFNDEITHKNREGFLQVIMGEFYKENKLAELTKDIAYRIIADILPDNKFIAGELIRLNKNDTQIAKDTMRYRLSSRK